MDNDWIATQATAYFCAAFLPLGALAVAAQGTWRATVISEGGDLARSEELNRLAPPSLVGLIERCLYLASWLEGTPEFIGVWLALKIAGGWKAWSEGLTIPSGKRSGEGVVIPGRTLVNLFLVNSGLSVLHAIAVGKALQLFMANAPRPAIEVAAAPYILTIGIALYGMSSARRGRPSGSATSA